MTNRSKKIAALTGILMLAAWLLVHSGPAFAVDEGKAKQWEQMPESQKQELRERLEEWKKASPEEKQKLIQAYKRFQALGSGEKTQLLRAYEYFKSLPTDRQNKLRERLKEIKDLSPEEQANFWKRLLERRAELRALKPGALEGWKKKKLEKTK